jgi:hypothetical protein
MLNKTYAFDELFKMSPTFDAEFKDGVLYIDNFYENPELIFDWLQSRTYPLWKYNSERESRNGVDYNDCRITDKVAHPTRIYMNEMERVLNLCRQYWWKGRYEWDMIQEFNVFQTLEVFDPKMQHYPHTDSELGSPDHLATLNMLVYLDKEESGGTALYEGTWLNNNEDYNLLFPVEDRFDIRQKVPAKFNRCVIFPGNQIHGAYVDDYTKYTGESWRYSQVQFFHPTRK